MGMAVIAGIGLGLQVLGGLSQAHGQAKALDEQAKINEQNAALAEAEGTELMRRGALQEYQLRGQGGQILGAQKTAYGASGVVGNVGSAADVEFGSRLALEMDAAALRFGAENERYAKRVEAWNYRRGAASAKSAAAMAVPAGLVGAGGTLLTGMSQVNWGGKNK